MRRKLHRERGSSDGSILSQLLAQCKSSIRARTFAGPGPPVPLHRLPTPADTYGRQVDGARAQLQLSNTLCTMCSRGGGRCTAGTSQHLAAGCCKDCAQLRCTWRDCATVHSWLLHWQLLDLGRQSSASLGQGCHKVIICRPPKQQTPAGRRRSGAQPKNYLWFSLVLCLSGRLNTRWSSCCTCDARVLWCTAGVCKSAGCERAAGCSAPPGAQQRGVQAALQRRQACVQCDAGVPPAV
jgi:hypothetical protein